MMQLQAVRRRHLEDLEEVEEFLKAKKRQVSMPVTRYKSRVTVGYR